MATVKLVQNETFVDVYLDGMHIGSYQDATVQKINREDTTGEYDTWVSSNKGELGFLISRGNEVKIEYNRQSNKLNHNGKPAI